MKVSSGHAPSGGSSKDPSLALPSFWWIPTLLAISCLVTASFQSLPPSSQAFFLIWVSVCLLLFFQVHWSLDLVPTLIQYVLTLTNYICKDIMSQEVTFRDSRWTYISGGHYLTHYSGRGDLTNHSCEWKQDCSEGGLKGIGSKARKVLAKLWRFWIPMWIEEARELMRHLTNTNLAKIGAKD